MLLWSIALIAVAVQGFVVPRPLHHQPRLQATVSLTDDAAAYVVKMMATEKEKPKFLRLGVKQGGCGNEFSYTIDFCHETATSDLVEDHKNFGVAIDENAVPYLRGLHLDVADGSLTFDNPNAKHACNCGNSFSLV